ncbi:hypothetical protein V6N13_096261 [Hibiscus sabdariffa]
MQRMCAMKICRKRSNSNHREQLGSIVVRKRQREDRLIRPQNLSEEIGELGTARSIEESRTEEGHDTCLPNEARTLVTDGPDLQVGQNGRPEVEFIGQ